VSSVSPDCAAHGEEESPELSDCHNLSDCRNLNDCRKEKG